MESEIKDDKNPIQANPINPGNPNNILDVDNIPKDKKPADQLVDEIRDVEEKLNKSLRNASTSTTKKEKCISVNEYLCKSKEFKHYAHLKEQEDGNVNIETDVVIIEKEEPMFKEEEHNREIRIEETDNGFLVCSWNPEVKSSYDNLDECFERIRSFFKAETKIEDDLQINI